MDSVICINKKDSVAISIKDLQKGDNITHGDQKIAVLNNINFGHKIAIANIEQGKKVIKFGAIIGSATKDIKMGEHVHSHNLATDYI